jgi:hypothetical protein
MRESYLVRRPRDGRASRFAYDLAHGCFLLWGLTVLSISVIRRSYTDSDWAGGAGAILLLCLPLLLASFLAMLVAMVLSVMLRRQWTLAILAGMSILLIPTFFSRYGSTAFHTTIDILYGVGVTGLSGSWFLALRWRHCRATVPAVKE